MAEQASHHVVDNPESTSASALVDVAANQTTTATADHGTHDPTHGQSPIPQTHTDLLRASQSANAHATQANASVFTSKISPSNLTEHPQENTTAMLSTTVEHNPAEIVPPLVSGTYSTLHPGDGVADDASAREDSVDASVNSDTEGSRGDGSEVKKDEKYHIRTNSVKKPVTFSKVSVTKNFLAKSATVTQPTIVKAKEKPSLAGTPLQSTAAKPRLIAKVGTSLRDVQKARLTAENVGGPDASKVWNKNRPVQPPPPRQFTDEELKQQYGIHLATRLQTDEEGKQSKWADIDEDEEDWAPDTVEWMDGTKSTLTTNEAAQPVAQDQVAAVAATTLPPKPAEGVRPTLIMKKPTELGPSKTVLKAGAAVAAAHARQNDSGSGMTTEKPVDASKDSTTLPAKSPWAVLPPVEKISPVNPPVQQKQPPPFVSQDARTYEPGGPAPPAREIAADTFDRSWREGEGGTRELFNSTNGRYEPVQDGRRGSTKQDSTNRKPALLQRPSSNATTPAEPSAAFQTRSSAQNDGSWAHRRGSSVSQGSLPPGRRISTSRTSDASPAPERRGSNVIPHDSRTSPKIARGEPAQPVFAQQSAWQRQMPPQPDAGQAEARQEEEDPVKVQERIMREKREEAKRRHEEEARLETEKKERLRAKLASLEGAGKSRKEREAEAAAAAVSTNAMETTTSEKEPEFPPSAPATNEAPTAPIETAEASAPALTHEAQTQIVPPADENHHSGHPVDEATFAPPTSQKQATANVPERPLTSGDQAQRQSRTHLSPRANARAPFHQAGAQFKPSTSSYSSPGDRKQQPYERSPLTNSNTFSPWPTTAPNGNVWGTSGIGNGTFESSNVFAPVPMSQQSSLPLPPGMPRPPGSSRISPQSIASESHSPSLQQQSIAEPSRVFGPPGLDPRQDAFANQVRLNGTSPAPGLGRQTHLPGPIAPPSRAQQPTQQQPSQRQASLAAWNNAAITLPYQYKSDAGAAESQSKEAVAVGPRDDTFRETFRQTSSEPGKLGAARRYDKTEYTIHDAQGSRSVQTLSPAPPVAQTQPSGPFSTAQPKPQDPWKASEENTVRIPDGSLNPAHGGVHGGAHGGMHAQLPPIGPPSSHMPIAPHRANVNYPKTPLLPSQDGSGESPPPPETSSHPVYGVEGGQPHVRLPPKKPTVKLPPAQVSTASPVPQETPIVPHRPVQNWGPPGNGTRPLVMQEAWQARFKSLFNRTTIQTETPPSPPKTPPKMQGPALAVASSSRVAMDDGAAFKGATVSLPPGKRVTSAEGFTIDDSTSMVSKPMIEEMFKEELSFGSLPIIDVPKTAVYKVSPAPIQPNLSARAVEGRSKPELDLLTFHQARSEEYSVHLPSLGVLGRTVKHGIRGKKASPMQQERKTSGRLKGRQATGPSATPSPASLSTPSGKTNLQKARTTPSSSPAITAASGASEPGRKTSWARPAKGRSGRVPTPAKAA